MTRKTHGLKVLGLSLIAAVGMMAVTAGAAQAAEFKLNGVEFKNVPLTEETFTGTAGAGKLLVPGLLTLECTGGKANGKVFAGGTGLAEAKFEGCKVEGNNFCKVYPTEADRNAKTNVGIVLATGKGSLLLMGGKHFLLLEEDGKAFTTVWFSKAAEGCALNSGETVTGSTVAEVEDALTNQATHALKPLTEAEIKALYPTDLLSYGAKPAWLDGGLATVELSGAKKGVSWSGE